ncbi:MAG: hypothetical protein ACXVJ2_16190 [Candidatus Angelobacter sp.]
MEMRILRQDCCPLLLCGLCVDVLQMFFNGGWKYVGAGLAERGCGKVSSFAVTALRPHDPVSAAAPPNYKVVMVGRT